ncbi:MAG TPA: hypothetical protein PLK82_03580 [Bacteroidales bacterium]|nr:hypothetical protein [Bacteroidales bacterium]
MKKHPYSTISLVVLAMWMTVGTMAQRISFGLYATDDIVLIPGSVSDLDFNSKQSIILPGNTVTISLSDNPVAVLTLTAREDLDVTVTLISPSYLWMDADNKIPFSLQFAYSNQGAGNEIVAKTQAIPVPGGFTTVTVPVLRRAGGPPGPPPAPPTPGHSLPTAVTYLFVYGVLGPVPMNVSCGEYSGIINVHASYSVTP